MKMIVGHQMSNVIAYVAAHPGCTSLEARRNAVSYGRGWSNAHSDAVMSRCRRQGLVEARQGKGGRLALYVTERGAQVLA